MTDVTRILQAVAGGDKLAAAELFPLVYDELRRIAAHKMNGEKAGQTLQPTALVHEVWLKLAGPEGETRFNNRAHFFGAAAEAMRRILVDKARYKLRERHGGGLERVVNIEWENLDVASASNDETILALHEALEKLAAKNPVAAKLAELRYFMEMSHAEACESLELSDRTGKREMVYARAFLMAELKKNF